MGSDRAVTDSPRQQPLDKPGKHGQVLLPRKQTPNPGIMPGKASPWARGCAPALFLLGLELGPAGRVSLPRSELQRLLVFPLSHLGEEADKAGLGLGRCHSLSLELQRPPGTFQSWIWALLGTNCDGSWQGKLPRKGQSNRNPLENGFHTLGEG